MRRSEIIAAACRRTRAADARRLASAPTPSLALLRLQDAAPLTIYASTQCHLGHGAGNGSAAGRWSCFSAPRGAAATEARIPQIPAEITLNSADVTLDAEGQIFQLTATVVDENGDPLPDATVSWESSDVAVVTVSATGLLTGQGPARPR